MSDIAKTGILHQPFEGRGKKTELNDRLQGKTRQGRARLGSKNKESFRVVRKEFGKCEFEFMVLFLI